MTNDSITEYERMSPAGKVAQNARDQVEKAQALLTYGSGSNDEKIAGALEYIHEAHGALEALVIFEKDRGIHDSLAEAALDLYGEPTICDEGEDNG